MRLHRQFGFGLKDLYNPYTKKLNHQALLKAPYVAHYRRLGQGLPGEFSSGIVDFAGVQINAE